MKVVIINKSDGTGGAAVVSMRLMQALRLQGVDARMLVAEKTRESAHVELAASPGRLRRTFLAERLRIFLANGLSRKTLFKIDTASDGVPLWRHPWVREADVICLNWVNQGLLSLHGVEELGSLGKPVVWTMHDMWCATGVCHHTDGCLRYMEQCGHCPLLGGRASADDLSHRTWTAKRSLYGRTGIHWVAVSNWLAERCRESSLLGGADVTVIPNAFPVDRLPELLHRDTDGSLRIVMGAARLDDPVKGLPLLVEATRALAAAHPDLAARVELVTFGDIRRPGALSGLGVAHRHLGRLSGHSEIRKVYESGHVVVSSSLYETLPGTLVEGMAYGCVPVSFDRGGQGDIVDHRETGWLAHLRGRGAGAAEGENLAANGAALAAGLAWALAAPHAVRERARKTVEERFAAPAVARSYIALFNSLLSKR